MKRELKDLQWFISRTKDCTTKDLEFDGQRGPIAAIRIVESSEEIRLNIALHFVAEIRDGTWKKTIPPCVLLWINPVFELVDDEDILIYTGSKPERYDFGMIQVSQENAVLIA
ncbi:MAG: hypothetical protein V4686_00745 [Patescibacteria group bacterium]